MHLCRGCVCGGGGRILRSKPVKSVSGLPSITAILHFSGSIDGKKRIPRFRMRQMRSYFKRIVLQGSDRTK